MSGGRERAAAAGPIGYALARAARAHRVALQSHLAALGLYPGQELVIVDLAENPDSTQGDLVTRLGVEQPTIAKTIARMERTGFLGRHRDGNDRRVVRLRLTSLGESVVDSVVDAWVAADAAAVDGLTERQRQTLVSLLDRLADVDGEEND
jgi:DNA-binding MarR family transcriptional regulator